jgi:hypothetical protein
MWTGSDYVTFRIVKEADGWVLSRYYKTSGYVVIAEPKTTLPEAQAAAEEDASHAY